MVCLSQVCVGEFFCGYADWVDAPPCDGCRSKTRRQGTGSLLSSEIQYGASRVELYLCSVCSRITRFPRYTDPLKLVETRRGRCGEWSNCFTLYCRAFGYKSRLIYGFTDHGWTECFSQALGRWMHLDPSEGVYDRPLLYEKGWSKELNYAIAIAKDGVYDVTKRYTRKWDEVLSRRNITTEPALSAVLTTITQECRRGFTSQVLSELDDCDKKEREVLERDLHSTDDDSISLPGRQSGDKE
ncbi:peptide-N(4)-(N-acetyl-beta-glucosaminyl)asparagine amidase-like [Alnus glutinosa]|uniref:peptide-N(4)-(N-acetyl-beta- glucosaminyl)asparagine amidase-like n=1 Tax=Alnus glutinosa TaxID=3517 RepID=UPI002D7659F6|nr:peptide-N(4)-(N-acetyl-beta-glucosaminyl)asparagine amidase-like [Alnus glutinosa]